MNDRTDMLHGLEHGSERLTAVNRRCAKEYILGRMPSESPPRKVLVVLNDALVAEVQVALEARGEASLSALTRRLLSAWLGGPQPSKPEPLAIALAEALRWHQRRLEAQFHHRVEAEVKRRLAER